MQNEISIEKSKLFSIYLHELGWLCNAIITNCKEIFEQAPAGEQGYIKVSPELHGKIVFVLINASNIKKLVFTPHKRFKDETKVMYEFRQQRGKFLKQFLSDLTIKELLNSRVRNSLEHFDEYLDEENIRLSGKHIGTMAAYNITLSDWDITNPRVAPIRVYIASERKFYNMEHSIDFGKLHDEATEIFNKLKQLEIIPPDGPGGMMIPV